MEGITLEVKAKDIDGLLLSCLSDVPQYSLIEFCKKIDLDSLIGMMSLIGDQLWNLQILQRRVCDIFRERMLEEKYK